MYAKTNPQAGRLTPRQKRIFAIAAVVVIVVFGGLTAWGLVAHDSYGGSANGCVNVTVPNSTGGSTLHYCGSQAKSFCQASFRSRTRSRCGPGRSACWPALGPSADPSAGASK